VAKTFRLTGILNLQTIEDIDGTQRLMEVNTRASGGIGMTALTNVNLPGLLLDAIDGAISDLPARVNGEVQAARRDVFWPV
jgi:predicted ATP-grasp superfamily ATP-dependent carboligase